MASIIINDPINSADETYYFAVTDPDGMPSNNPVDWTTYAEGATEIEFTQTQGGESVNEGGTYDVHCRLNPASGVNDAFKRVTLRENVDIAGDASDDGQPGGYHTTRWPVLDTTVEAEFLLTKGREPELGDVWLTKGELEYTHGKDSDGELLVSGKTYAAYARDRNTTSGEDYDVSYTFVHSPKKTTTGKQDLHSVLTVNPKSKLKATLGGLDIEGAVDNQIGILLRQRIDEKLSEVLGSFGWNPNIGVFANNEKAGVVMQLRNALEAFFNVRFSQTGVPVRSIAKYIGGGEQMDGSEEVKQIYLDSEGVYNFIADRIQFPAAELSGLPPWAATIEVSRAQTGQTTLWSVSSLGADRVKIKLSRVDGVFMNWSGDTEPLVPGAVGRGQSDVFVPTSGLYPQGNRNIRLPLNPSPDTTGVPANTPIWVWMRDERDKTKVYKFQIIIPVSTNGIEVIPVGGGSGGSAPYLNKPIEPMYFSVGIQKTIAIPADTVISSSPYTVEVDESTPLPAGVSFDPNAGAAGSYTGNISAVFPSTQIIHNFINASGTTPAPFYMQGLGGDVIEWIEVGLAGGPPLNSYMFVRIKTTTNQNPPELQYLIRGIPGDSNYADYQSEYAALTPVTTALPRNILDEEDIVAYSRYPEEYYTPDGANWFIGFADEIFDGLNIDDYPATIWVKRGAELIEFNVPPRLELQRPRDFMRYYPVDETYTNMYMSLGGEAGGNPSESNPKTENEGGTTTPPPPAANQAPYRNTQTAFLTAYTGVQKTFNFPADRFIDSNNDPLTWSVEYSPFNDGNYGLQPNWATFNGPTRAWTVTAPAAGSYAFRLKVSDGRGGVAYDPFILSITNNSGGGNGGGDMTGFNFPVPDSNLETWPQTRSEAIANANQGALSGPVGQVFSLNSDQLRVDLVKRAGGAMRVFNKTQNRYLVNWHDLGRQAENTWYRGPQNHSQYGHPYYYNIGDNPITPGDVDGNPSIILKANTFTYNGMQGVYTKTQLVNWGMTGDPGGSRRVDPRPVYAEVWTILNGREIIRYSRTTFDYPTDGNGNESFQNYPFNQETPSSMIPGNDHTLHMYLGGAPFTGDTASQTNAMTTDTNSGTQQPFIAQNFNITEPWAAYNVSNSGQFWGIYSPEMYGIYVSRPGAGDNDHAEGSNQLTNIANNPFMTLDPKGVYVKEVRFYLGESLQEVRNWANAFPRRTSLDFLFVADRGNQGFYAVLGNAKKQVGTSLASDGYRVDILSSNGDQREFRINSPAGSWRTTNFNKIWIKYRYQGNQTTGYFYWILNGQSPTTTYTERPEETAFKWPNGAFIHHFGEQNKTFPLNGDGQWHTAEITLTGAGWHDTMTRFWITPYAFATGPYSGDTYLELMYVGTNNPDLQP